MLSFTKKLIALRHATPALDNEGDWTLVSDVNRPYPMVYKRTHGTQAVYIALNPSGKAVTAKVAGITATRVLITTGKASCKSGNFKLAPCSAIVVEAEK